MPETPRPHIGERSLTRGLHSSDAPWTILLTLLSLAGLGHLLVTHPAINWDCALYLQCGQLMLEGRIPYVDFADNNPPLIMYVSAVPALLARILAVEPTLAFALFVALLFAVSLWEIRLLLRHAGPGLGPDERGLLALAWVAGNGAILLAGKWGQREHLFIMAAMPYLLLRAVRDRDRPLPGALAVPLGLQAAVGACLKPQFLIAVAAVELFLALSRRSWRRLLEPEVLAVAGFTLAYLAHWLLVPASMRTAYFERWIPLHAGRYELAYGITAVGLAQRLVSRALGYGLPLLPLLAASALAVSRRTRVPRLLAPLTVFAWFCLANYLQQRKGWGYHLIPLYLATLFVATLLLLELRRALEERAHGRRLASALVIAPFGLALLAAPFAGALVLQEATHPVPAAEPLARLRQVIDRWTRPGDPVLFLSTSVMPGYPLLVQMNRRPASRYLWIFPIALFYPRANATSPVQAYPYRDPARATAEERRFLAELLQDVLRHRPRLILVKADSFSQGVPPGFCVYDYLVHTGVVGALVPEHYREDGRLVGWRVLVPSERPGGTWASAAATRSGLEGPNEAFDHGRLGIPRQLDRPAAGRPWRVRARARSLGRSRAPTRDRIRPV